MDLPLTGIRVLDLTKVLAGPLCTQYLGDMGAEVIKVEPTSVGDETRKWPPYKDGTGAVFLSVNRNKRSIAVDLKKKDGVEVVHRLARWADVAIESFAPGVAAKLGVDYPALKQCNEKLVYCSISGYGQFGPLSRSPGYDLILQAFSGLLTITGEEGGGPIRSPMSPIDQGTGMNALSGILAALLRRERTGKGGYLEVSLFETSLALLAYMLQNYWESGKLPSKSGCGHPSLCPYQVFQAIDRDILIGVPNDNLWRRFCHVVGLPQFADDPRFSSNAARVENADQTIDFVQSIIASRPCDEWTALLGDAGIPCAPLNTLQDLLDHPHTRARGIVADYEHPELGASKTVLQPIVFDQQPRSVGVGAPLLGQHTIDILASLGYDTREIEDLVSRHCVRVA
jgi:crotonobetainyl-CoA:carnitine CoA-transferase CaiB-like acyl-CoA transferase